MLENSCGHKHLASVGILSQNFGYVQHFLCNIADRASFQVDHQLRKCVVELATSEQSGSPGSDIVGAFSTVSFNIP